VIKLRQAIDQIPELDEAIKKAVSKEQFDRNLSMLQLPETVCGVSLRPLTLSDMVRHSVVGSPFINGGWHYDVTQTLRFYTLQCTHRSAFRKWQMRRRLVSRVNLDIAADAALEFVEGAFTDAPVPSGVVDGPSYYSPGVAAVDLLAQEYGWTLSEIQSLPLKILFQFYNRISHRQSPRAILFNPSDRVRGDWMNSANKQNN
jgi:hypothetical protein